MKIPNSSGNQRTGSISLARIVSEDSQRKLLISKFLIKSSKDS